MQQLNLRQLKVFEAEARHLSLLRAAEELHLTKPAVSMQVKSFEEDSALLRSLLAACAVVRAG